MYRDGFPVSYCLITLTVDEGQNTISKNEALSLLTRYCSKEEHCIFDAREKLKNYKLHESTIEEIVHFLVKEKYIDELRYSLAFVNDKSKFNKWGRFKIRYSLKQKQIPENIIKEALENISDDECRQILHDELSKKLRSLPKASNYELKGKLYRFAAGRGFENDIILEVIGELLEE